MLIDIDIDKIPATLIKQRVIRNVGVSFKGGLFESIENYAGYKSDSLWLKLRIDG